MVNPQAKILVVDDSWLARESLVEMLAPLGYQVATAHDGESAMESVGRDRPDLILLDVMMPGMDGFQVAKLLRQNPQTENIPIIMVSMLAGAENRVKGLGSGADYFISKPVRNDELMERVQRLLAQRQEKAEAAAHRARLEQSVAERTALLERSNLELRREVERRARAEGNLAASQKLYEDLYQNSPDLLASVDPATGGIIKANRTLCARLGYQEHQLLAKTLCQIHAPFSHALLEQVLADLSQGQEPADLELVMQAGDGETFPCSVSVNAFLDDQGHAAVARFSWRDISRRKGAEEELAKARSGLERAQKIAHLGSWEWDIAGDLFYCSDEIYRIFGHKPQSITPTHQAFMDAVHHEDREQVSRAIQDSLASGEMFDLEYRIHRPDGGESIVRAAGEISQTKEGKPTWAVGTVQDITLWSTARDQLALAEKIFDNSLEGIMITGEGGRITYVNRAFTIITGYLDEEVIGKTPDVLKSDRHPPEFYRKMWETINRFGEWAGEVWNRRKTGEAYLQWETILELPAERGPGKRHVAVFHDITDMRQNEEALEHHSNHDALTGLPVRRVFMDRLGVAIKRLAGGNDHVAVFSLDLDNFKGINDSLGHLAGDSLLQRVAQRLEKELGKKATLSRLGGDQFNVMVEGVEQASGAMLLAQGMLAALAPPFTLDGASHYVTACIGVSLAPEDGATPELLVKNADLAMHRAKKKSRGAMELFTPGLNDQALKRLSMENRLRQALEQNQLVLHYQPKIRLMDGSVNGMEALVRWQEPDGRLVPPLEFIPLAEENGLIVPIGRWVLNEALAAVKRWRQNPAWAGLKVAVNFSARQFAEDDLVPMVAKALLSSGLPPDALELEITESVFMARGENAEATLKRFADMGFSISLDDFGTGYSSLSYLRRLPIHSLKIDKSFVDDLPANDGARAMARAIVSLAAGLNLGLVAEGVENPAQLDFLRALGCDQVQGYYFSRPLPEHEFTAFMRAHAKPA